MGSFSIWHWLIVLVIIMLVFGTKKIGNIGSDLGKAVKGFKENIKVEEERIFEIVYHQCCGEDLQREGGEGDCQCGTEVNICRFVSGDQSNVILKNF